LSKAQETPIKKFPKLSQKERKKLSSVTDGGSPSAAAKPLAESKGTWGGWATPVEGDKKGTPSLTAIMQVEARSRSGEEVIRYGTEDLFLTLLHNLPPPPHTSISIYVYFLHSNTGVRKPCSAPPHPLQPLEND
jgi:hypothetical protein